MKINSNNKNWVVISEEFDQTKPSIQTITPATDKHDQSFSELACQLVKRKENMGSFNAPDASGIFTGWCGDTMQIQLLLDGDVIKEARFMTDGCGATIACGSMITKMIHLKSMDQVLEITPADLLTELISIPDDHEHCLSLAITTLRIAIKNAQEIKKKQT
jgi:nitrogen fixation NifU-like protein